MKSKTDEINFGFLVESLVKQNIYNTNILNGATIKGQALFRFRGLTNEFHWNEVEKILLKNEFTGTEPKYFNDPFEIKPKIIGEPNIELINMLKDFQNIPDKVKLEKQHYKQFIDGIYNNIYQNSIAKATITCLNLNYSSNLMWSNYANSHKGICLMFMPLDIKTELDVFNNRRIVKYQNYRNILHYNQLLNILINEQNHNQGSKNKIHFSSPYEDIYNLYFLSKEISWAYEEEVRIIHKNNSSKKFNSYEIIGIILGASFDTLQKDRLNKLVKESKLPIPFYKSRLSQSTYSVEIDWDNPLYEIK